MKDKHSEDYLTVDEVADRLRVPRQTIYIWRHNGTAPPAIKLGRHLRFRAEALEEWLTTRES